MDSTNGETNLQSTVKNPGFIFLIITQFLGAFNDNAFKTLIILYLSAHVADGEKSFNIALATSLFIAPFILFSTYCGYFCDKFSKQKVMVAVKCWEIIIMLFGLGAFYFQSAASLFIGLFFLGLHSTLYSPAKYGILPEILKDEELSNGNGIIELTTFISIIGGTVFGSVLYKYYKANLCAASLFFIFIAAAGLLMSFFIQKTRPAGVHNGFKLNFLSDVDFELRRAYKDRALFLSIIAITYFWLVATAVNNNIITYSKEMMKITEDEMGLFLAALALGIGLGSGIAGKVSGETVELGLVPAGAAGMTVFLFDLYFSYSSMLRTGTDLFLVGLFGGFFIVPLHAFLQQKAPEGETGRIIGLTNFTSNLFMVVASFAVYFLHEFVKISPAAIFAVSAAATLIATFIIVHFMPGRTVRFFRRFTRS